MDIRNFQHVIWDWNGTLFDDAALCVDVMNGLLRKRNLPVLTPARYQAIFDFPVVLYYQRLGFDLQHESFEALGTEFITAYEKRRSEAGLQPQARAVLEGVRRAGIAQSVLSAYRHATLEHLLAEQGVRDFFTHVVGSDDHYASGKVEQGRRFIRRLSCPASAVVLVGDTVHDHEVAVAMGVNCILIPAGNHSRERLVACGVPVADSLKDLLPS